jgi:hypothetical protein
VLIVCVSIVVVVVVVVVVVAVLRESLVLEEKAWVSLWF